MEIRNTKTFTYRRDFSPLENFDGGDELTRQRLDALLKINAETALEKSLFASEMEKVEAGLMKNPLSNEQAFGYFGLLLGTLMPTTLFLRILLDARSFPPDGAWVVGVVAVVTLISAIVGFFSGKLVGKIVRQMESFSWLKMILLLPFVGIIWGMAAGGAGGVIIFIIGAIFGGALGATVGSIALPAFAICHRLLKKGDQIDKKHFLPLAFGITLTISAFMLGI
jgi:hypothetical protein